MKNRISFLFSAWFMAVLFILFAFAMAMATFIENDFGAITARKIVYNSKWFEFLMLLMMINLIGQILKFKLYKRNKIPVLLFHLAFIIMIIGAGVTRYFGYEGRIHIREGESENKYLTTDRYINVKIEDKDNNLLFKESKQFVATSIASDRFKVRKSINGNDYRLKFKRYIPNAEERLINSDRGKAIISLIISKGMMQRNIVISEGEVYHWSDLKISFDKNDLANINLDFKKDTFRITVDDFISETSMMTRDAAIHPKDTILNFLPMKIYHYNSWKIIVQESSPSGIIAPVSLNWKTQQTGKSALEFELEYGNKKSNLFVWMGNSNKLALFQNGSHKIEVDYASNEFELPFELKLNKFVVERYPGSNSPSSYKSDVVLIDKGNNVEIPYQIYMNHILKYKGYRFYQASFDKDEKGTVLSVNHDTAGMYISYAGYFILFLFILASLVSKHSVFRKVNHTHWSGGFKKVLSILVLVLLSSTIGFANPQESVIDKEKADEFGKILVQDQKGRTKPLFTLSNDILRKISRESEYKGFSSMQVYLGIYYNFNHWKDVPMIKISNSEVKNLLSIRGDYAAFTDIVNLTTNMYKLSQHVNTAYNKAPGARSKFDKEVIKVDERVNIFFMIYKGDFMKIFPLNDGTDKWGKTEESLKFANNEMDSLYLKNILNLYYESVLNGETSGDYKQADEFLESIVNYQNKNAKYDLPSKSRINAELLYYKSGIFEKLFPFYATIGLIIMIILIYQIIAGSNKGKVVIQIFSAIIFIGFVAHTTGYALRWYISGYAPMSNGYESMIFISWVTILAGFIFRKKSDFALPATSLLASLTLMVAHLSFMDPEITNLVPVLKSYWLTLHVSVITGSYAFLGMGAILGLIVLILYSIFNDENKDRIQEKINELTVLNYKSLTIGLYLLTIGTFLGAIWANESWGRYWGWDPKETWSLITIIVYSFVIHSKMIPTLKSIYNFNFMALFAFSSVLMTYFGVNYYLSGLHSYAGGDAVPIPKFVYVSVIALFILSIFAYRRYIKIVKEE